MHTIARNELNSVPTKYFSANDWSFNWLNLAKLFAVSTNPMAPYCPISPNISIISLSNIPIQRPIFASSFSLLLFSGISLNFDIFLNIIVINIALGFAQINIIQITTIILFKLTPHIVSFIIFRFFKEPFI